MEKQWRFAFHIWRIFLNSNELFVPLLYVCKHRVHFQYILDSNDEITKGVEYDVLVPWLGTGLLIRWVESFFLIIIFGINILFWSTDDKWRVRRKMLTPTFHFSMLDGYLAIMNRHAKVRCFTEMCRIIFKDLHRTSGRPSRHQSRHVSRCENVCTRYNLWWDVPFLFELWIVWETAMGKELDSQRHPNQPYVEAIVNLMSLGTKIAMSFHLWTPLMRWIGKNHLKQ